MVSLRLFNTVNNISILKVEAHHLDNFCLNNLSALSSLATIFKENDDQREMPKECGMMFFSFFEECMKVNLCGLLGVYLGKF